MNKDSKIYIAGHAGMVGSAIHRKLKAEGFNNIVTRPREELDLLDQRATAEFFAREKPEYVFLAAAKVGGIMANNTYRAQFIYENLQIQNNVIHQSYLNGVKKLLFLGSSCIYPKHAPQPMKEEHLLTGKLEPTNEPYAIAKIAGIKMCESYNAQYDTNYISAMPTNIYGPNDNFDLETSHVLPALIRKMHLGKCLENEDWDALRKDLDKRPLGGVDGKAGEKEILAVLEANGIGFKSTVGSGQLASGSIQSPVTSGQSANKDKVQTANYQLPTYVTLWGSGNPRREFLHVEDLADACYFMMQNYDDSQFVNVGVGGDISIKELALLIKDILGYEGELKFDTSKPDGTPRKLLDVNRLNDLGWKARIGLREGIEKTFKWYKGIGYTGIEHRGSSGR